MGHLYLLARVDKNHDLKIKKLKIRFFKFKLDFFYLNQFFGKIVSKSIYRIIIEHDLTA
jgi:hypothetical protein